MVISGVRRQSPRSGWRRRSGCVRSARGSLWCCGKPKRCRWQRTPKRENCVDTVGGDDVSVAAANVWPRKRLKYAVSLRRTRVDGADDERPYVGLAQIESGTGRLVPTAAVVA